MDHIYEGAFSRIILKPLTYEYIEQLRQLRNRDDIRCWFINSSLISIEEQENWYKKYLTNSKEYMFVAFEKKYPGVFIGSWGAYNFSDDGLIFEAGRRMISYDKVSERGLGYDIVCCGLDTIFSNTKAEKVYSEVLSNNERSIHSNLKVGYKIIKTIKKGKHELVYLEMTKKEFYNNLSVNK